MAPTTEDERRRPTRRPRGHDVLRHNPARLATAVSQTYVSVTTRSGIARRSNR
ncbi:hypothetical protein N136_04895 [Leifsonia aquatica ATCC 14665]|uniref:Uncharacterized protein n=1 Tax=Leifsonia aquatica ATCC 14665 TaxID=1358026 RepID=U2QDF2_LEIAQ|nr:hypothetical protein N136_04895 [Leifsonia aquatica ATCC 14665]